MTMAAAAVGILRCPAALRPYAAPRRQAASCSFQLRAAPAHLRAMSRPAPRPSPRVAPRLRCAPSGEGACVVQGEEEENVAAQDEGKEECVAAQDEEKEEEYVVLPPWMPTEEEVDELLALDMSWAAIDERFRRESVEARAAVLGALVDVLRPLRDNFSDLRSLKYVHETEEFHIGMPFGALMTCIGLYHLWKVAPNLCLDVAMPYAFYKLSVLAADVRRRGFSTDLIIRIKLALAVAMFMKDIHLKCTALDLYVRVPVYVMYTVSVLWDLSGMKRYAKYALATIIYEVTTFFQNTKSMMEPGANVRRADDAKLDGGVVQCVLEPDNSSLCGAKEGGDAPQFLQEPAIDVEVDNSGCVIEDGKLPHFITSKSHHTNEEEDGELQFVSEPVDSSNLEEESELPQFVVEPENSRLCGVKEGGDTMQFLHEPAIAVEVDKSSSVIEDGKLPHFTSKSHHTDEEEDVSKPGDSSNF